MLTDYTFDIEGVVTFIQTPFISYGDIVWILYAKIQFCSIIE